ncbi:preprotein translocase subunit SecE [Halotalea alkalilenta]|uniref:Protein translocase subunit SecE n=1 Tax=Halotalea alkalilenta TaxID=376489 RepID=A0A172YJK2_9GAMM|nr:preprotein translocase subunit SecE [Halotalea alkalilenta]ANF59389.1 preprotein translocase subunit SecE [Halotalea alkalilenta]
MKNNAEVQTTSRHDAIKWAIAVVLVALAVAGNIYFADQPLLYRVLGVVVVAGLGVYVGFTTAKGRELIELGRSAKKEIQRVVWPTRQETIQTTAIVMVAVLIVGLVLWLIDTLLGWLVSGIIG